jgi:hypothetical protein
MYSLELKQKRGFRRVGRLGLHVPFSNECIYFYRSFTRRVKLLRRWPWLRGLRGGVFGGFL